MNSEFSQILVGGAIGFVSAIFAEPLRRWIFSPKLILSFEDCLDFRSRTPETITYSDLRAPEIHEAEYVRIKVVNDARPMAKNCRAFLVGIEKKQANGLFEPTFYCDSIPLAWSCREDKAHETLDLPNGVAQFIDIVSVRSISNNFRLEIKPVPHRYSGFFHDKGTFRFKVQVSGENVKPVFISILFTWNGKWDDYNAQPDS